MDELARSTDRPGPAVARALESASGTVDSVGYELDQVLDAIAAPEPWAVETATRRLTARRRRIRGHWALAAVVVAALVTGATVLPGALRRSATPVPTAPGCTASRSAPPPGCAR